MDARWTRGCTVDGCERPPILYLPLLIGGEPVPTTWCGPHAAEYRVDEATR